MPAAAPSFRPLALAHIERMIRHARALGVATTADAALSALFLLYCEVKDAEAALRGEEVGATGVLRTEQTKAETINQTQTETVL